MAAGGNARRAGADRIAISTDARVVFLVKLGVPVLALGARLALGFEVLAEIGPLVAFPLNRFPCKADAVGGVFDLVGWHPAQFAPNANRRTAKVLKLADALKLPPSRGQVMV